MRSEKEMYQLILETAMQDERIRGVYINGSRTNKNVPRDIFQDYDIVYVVTETSGFITDKSWIDRFGQRLFMQYPDETPDCPSDRENFYGWLIQFADGNRLDLHVETLSHAKEHIGDDRLCEILLDKDGILPPMPEASDIDHWVKKPNRQQYLAVCNEFWWCLDNVAKGLWREEIPYVQDMMNFHVRKQLEKMLSWKIGTDTEFAVSVGKSGKYMYRFLTETEWQEYLSTYFAAHVGQAWEAVMKTCDLFERTALCVGQRLGYTYDACEGGNCRSYLEHVRGLPKNTAEGKRKKLHLDKIHHVAIIASDYEKSRSFYVDKLGFEIIRENYREQREDYKLDLRLGDCELEIFGRRGSPARLSYPEACGLRHIAFWVEDIEEAVRELKRLGIETEPIRLDEITNRKMTFFNDPDGLPLELHE